MDSLMPVPALPPALKGKVPPPSYPLRILTLPFAGTLEVVCRGTKTKEDDGEYPQKGKPKTGTDKSLLFLHIR